MSPPFNTWRRFFQYHGTALASLLVLGTALAHLILHVALQRGLYPGVVGFFSDANRLITEGAIGSAFYPPLVVWIATALKMLHIPLSPSIFSGVWFLLGMVLFYGFLYLVTHSRGWAWGGTIFAILNPYFIWTAMLSNDTGPEWVWFLCVVIALCLGARGVSKKMAFILMVFGGVGSVLTRVTGLYIVAALLLAAWIFYRSRLRSLIYVGALSLLTACGILLAWNMLQVNSATLSTNVGINLYFGNHPAYLQGHPQYDIDVFLREAAQQDVEQGLSEVEADKKFASLGWGFIRHDPAAFLYRALIKSSWYWIGLEKIPNYSGNIYLEIATRRVHLPEIDVRQGLGYMLYRVVCLGVIAWWLIGGRWKTPLEVWIVWSGWIGLWPIMILTFPDTRFHLVLETLLSAWIVCILYGFWRQRQDLLQSHV